MCIMKWINNKNNEKYKDSQHLQQYKNMMKKKELEAELQRVELDIDSYVFPLKSEASFSKSYMKGKRDTIKEILIGSWR